MRYWARASVGPSPHAREAAVHRDHGGLGRGSIPAHVGNRSPSPPFSAMVIGTIPARAGSRPSAAAQTLRQPEHPRTRGEQGSPGRRPGGTRDHPRYTRGTARFPWSRPSASGTIPAHAGNGRAAPPWWPCPRDYPRSRGEQAPGPGGGSCLGEHPRSRREQCFSLSALSFCAGPSPIRREQQTTDVMSIQMTGPSPLGGSSQPGRRPGSSPWTMRSRRSWARRSTSA